MSWTYGDLCRRQMWPHNLFSLCRSYEGTLWPDVLRHLSGRSATSNFDLQVNGDIIYVAYELNTEQLYFRSVLFSLSGHFGTKTLRHQDSSALNYSAEVSRHFGTGAEVVPKCPTDTSAAPICMRHFGTTVYLYRPYIVMHFVLYMLHVNT